MRTMSTAAITAAFDAETAEVFLPLLTITHPNLSAPLRYVSNTDSVTSRGNLFVAFPFELQFPGEDGDQIGDAQLRIDNVDRVIVRTLRGLSSPPTITIEVVLASSPDTVEASFPELVLRDARYDASQVRGTLRFEDIITEPVSVQMTPQRFPALF